MRIFFTCLLHNRLFHFHQRVLLFVSEQLLHQTHQQLGMALPTDLLVSIH